MHIFWRSIIICTYKFLLKWSPLFLLPSPPHHIKYQKAPRKLLWFFFSFSFSITIILRRDLIWHIYIFFLIEMPVWNSTGCFWGMGANARYLFPEIEKKTWLSSPSPQFFRPLINTNTNLVWSFNPSYHNNRIINLTPMSSGLFILLLLFYRIGDLHSDSGIWTGQKTPKIGLFW